MERKPQILYIHGGMTFKSKTDYLNYLKTKEISIDKKIRWSEEYLDECLGESSEIIRPRMPLREDAKYEEWKIYFERHFPYLGNKVILIGESLGGIFLAKYLSENEFPKELLSVYFVCPPFDGSLTGEDLVGGFELGGDLSLIEKNSKNVCLMFSKSDDVVPVSHSEKYASKLKNSKIIVYDDKNGHFKISEFPEIVELLKGDLKS